MKQTWKITESAPSRRRTTLILATLLSLLLVAVACVPSADEPILSPDLAPILIAKEKGQKIVVEPTPVPPKLAELRGEEIYRGLPNEFGSALAAADPTNGPNIALTQACIGCHVTDPSIEMTGPTWYNLGNTAVTRQLGSDISPALYLYNSIVAPGSYIVEGYVDGVMPADYEEKISTEDLADLVAYILEQTQE